MDSISARPEGECVYNPYSPKRRDVTDIYADWALICIYFGMRKMAQTRS